MIYIYVTRVYKNIGGGNGGSRKQVLATPGRVSPRHGDVQKTPIRKVDY